MSREADYAGLLMFTQSAHEEDVLKALMKHGSLRKAARALECHDASICRVLRKVRSRAERQGYAPEYNMHHAVPDSFVAKGVSTLYDENGNVRSQWVKSDLKSQARVEALRDAIDGLMEQCKGQSPKIALAKSVKPTEDLLSVYPMGDPHIGMYAWQAECGEDFDLHIARRDLLSAATRLVSVAPPSKRALIVNLGDFFHADNYSGVTGRSGNALDVDSRWPKVLQTGFHLMVDLITLALQKHETVEVINAAGNHDDHSAIALSSFVEAWFHNEPRVVVHPSVGRFNYVEFGSSLIGVTHGDTVKLTELDSLMAADKPEAWGRTKHRYWLTGHIHHKSVLELRGCIVESFRTLAGKDAYHMQHGYRAGRDMQCLVLDRLDGEIERHRCDIGMARRLAA